MEWQVPLLEGTLRAGMGSSQVSCACPMEKAVVCFLLKAENNAQLPLFLWGRMCPTAAPVWSRKDRQNGQNIHTRKKMEGRGYAGSPGQEVLPVTAGGWLRQPS